MRRGNKKGDERRRDKVRGKETRRGARGTCVLTTRKETSYEERDRRRVKSERHSDEKETSESQKQRKETLKGDDRQDGRWNERAGGEEADRRTEDRDRQKECRLSKRSQSAH